MDLVTIDSQMNRQADALTSNRQLGSITTSKLAFNLIVILFFVYFSHLTENSLKTGNLHVYMKIGKKIFKPCKIVRTTLSQN